MASPVVSLTCTSRFHGGMPPVRVVKENAYDKYHLVNGHDLSQILYLFLKKTLGCKNKMLVDHNAIEDSLILAFEIDDFRKTQLYQSLTQWDNNNGKILW